MGYLDGFRVTFRQAAARQRRRRGRHHRVPEGEAARRPSASTAATSSTATRTAWRSASAASCAPACARPAASTSAAPTTIPTIRCRPASATGSSTRSTTCAASTATSASRRARPRRSPSRSCSSSRFTNRADAIYTKDELVVDDDGKPAAAPVGGLVRRRRGRTAHLGVDAGHVAVGQRRATTAGWRGRASSASACRPPERGQSPRYARARRRPSQRRSQSRHAGTPTHGYDRRHGRRTTDGRARRLRRRRGHHPRRRGRRRSCSRNPVHSALVAGGHLFGVAVLFVDHDAHFLAAVQVIVYAGAIVVLFLFVIMLLGVDRAEDLSRRPARRPAPGRRRRRHRPARRRPRHRARSTDAASTSSSPARRRVAGAARRRRPTTSSVLGRGRCSPTTCSPSRSPRCCS